MIALPCPRSALEAVSAGWGLLEYLYAGCQVEIAVEDLENIFYWRRKLASVVLVLSPAQEQRS